MRRRIVLPTLSAMCSLALLAGCSTLPTNTDPQALRSFEPTPMDDLVAEPEPGQEPDLLVRGFFSALAHPTQQYQAARAYMSEEASSSWDPSVGTVVVDRVDLNTQPGATSSERTFSIRGTAVGQLGTGGVYTPENAEFESEIRLERIDGEWRITDLPPGVVLERNELRNYFQPHEVFFFNAGGDLLVGDRRWVYSGQQSMDAVLLNLLVSGPSSYIAPGVVNQLGGNASYLGMEDGTHHFSGLSDLTEDERLRFAAQVVWTLASSDIPGPYRIEADGSPLLENFPTLTVEDVADYNPQAYTNSVSTFFTLQDGSVSRVTSAGAAPLSGALSSGDIESAAISSSADIAAAVRGGGDQDTLIVGEIEGAYSDVTTAQTVTKPTFEPQASAVWAALDGETVLRVTRSAATGELVQSEVEMVLPDNANGQISELQLSRTGVRVAMIVEGRVFTGVISRPGPGERRVTNIVEVAPSLAGSALSLAWRPDGSLLVGTSIPETPVWRIEQDGSVNTALPSGNVTAPVVSVASSVTTMYATDAHALIQLPASDQSLWREVPGVQGVRAAPIVAN